MRLTLNTVATLKSRIFTMPKDEFKIIISKSGEIKVVMDGFVEEKVNNYTRMFEDVIGPVVHRIESDGSPSPSSTAITDNNKKKQEVDS